MLGIANWTAWWYSPSGKLTPQQIAEAMTDIGLFGLAHNREAQPPARTVDAAIKTLKAQIEQLEHLTK